MCLWKMKESRWTWLHYKNSFKCSRRDRIRKNKFWSQIQRLSLIMEKWLNQGMTAEDKKIFIKCLRTKVISLVISMPKMMRCPMEVGCTNLEAAVLLALMKKSSTILTKRNPTLKKTTWKGRWDNSTDSSTQQIYHTQEIFTKIQVFSALWENLHYNDSWTIYNQFYFPEFTRGLIPAPTIVIFFFGDSYLKPRLQGLCGLFSFFWLELNRFLSRQTSIFWFPLHSHKATSIFFLKESFSLNPRPSKNSLLEFPYFLTAFIN